MVKVDVSYDGRACGEGCWFLAPSSLEGRPARCNLFGKYLAPGVIEGQKHFIRCLLCFGKAKDQKVMIDMPPKYIMVKGVRYILETAGKVGEGAVSFAGQTYVKNDGKTKRTAQEPALPHTEAPQFTVAMLAIDLENDDDI